MRNVPWGTTASIWAFMRQARPLLSPLCDLLGFGLIIGGAYLLLGLGPALLMAGGTCLIVAYVLSE
jgi:hypothetical protein